MFYTCEASKHIFTFFYLMCFLGLSVRHKKWLLNSMCIFLLSLTKEYSSTHSLGVLYWSSCFWLIYSYQYFYPFNCPKGWAETFRNLFCFSIRYSHLRGKVHLICWVKYVISFFLKFQNCIFLNNGKTVIFCICLMFYPKFLTQQWTGSIRVAAYPVKAPWNLSTTNFVNIPMT